MGVFRQGVNLTTVAKPGGGMWPGTEWVAKIKNKEEKWKKIKERGKNIVE